MSESLELLLLSEMGLFILGVVYAVLLGNPKVPLIVRSLKAGMFFAFFYVCLPMIYWFGLGPSSWVDTCDLPPKE